MTSNQAQSDTSLGDASSVENGKYQVIYADPPWHFRTYSKKGRDRCPDNKHYQTMNLDWVKGLPISEIADDNCALFLWVIDPMLPQGLEVMKSWGFKFKTVAFTWVKKNRVSDGFFTGLGYWTRGNPEMCLLGTRGKPKRISKSVPQLNISSRREHSRKPDEIREAIVELMGDVPRVELFARHHFDGWDAWGDEVSHSQGRGAGQMNILDRLTKVTYPAVRGNVNDKA